MLDLPHFGEVVKIRPLPGKQVPEEGHPGRFVPAEGTDRTWNGYWQAQLLGGAIEHPRLPHSEPPAAEHEVVTALRRVGHLMEALALGKLEDVLRPLVGHARAGLAAAQERLHMDGGRIAAEAQVEVQSAIDQVSSTLDRLDQALAQGLPPGDDTVREHPGHDPAPVQSGKTHVVRKGEPPVRAELTEESK